MILFILHILGTPKRKGWICNSLSAAHGRCIYVRFGKAADNIGETNE